VLKRLVLLFWLLFAVAAGFFVENCSIIFFKTNFYCNFYKKLNILISKKSNKKIISKKKIKSEK
jgi:hypothetical protein